MSSTGLAAARSNDDINHHLPIRCTSKVVRGYGRGSSDLGIPTANLSRDDGSFSVGGFEEVPTGIYWGFARVGDGNDTADDTGGVFTAAISIGYNPTYGNKEKTIEPHLIASSVDKRRNASSCGETILRDFYDEPIKLSIVGYLRPELPFEGLEKLTEAIKRDITKSELLGTDPTDIALKELVWVNSKGTLLSSN